MGETANTEEWKWAFVGQSAMMDLFLSLYIYQGQPTQKLCHENVTFHLLHAYLLC